jgi:hypothetical protein
MNPSLLPIGSVSDRVNLPLPLRMFIHLTLIITY